MLIIPEIETVVILVPRTGSGSLRRALTTKYPKAMLPYRHMEADGVPAGYDRWRRVGVVRNPVDRLWSLYKFLRNFDGPHDPAYIASMRRSVQRPFSEWIVKNETVFTSPYDTAGRGRYWPVFTVRHALPENRKSQFIYLRPDLGTEVYRFDQLPDLWRDLGVECEHRHNATEPSPAPAISDDAYGYLSAEMSWDFAASLNLERSAA